ncbi:phage tail tape measure protein [Tenacibaculum piscium]|uniref:phage tail tape measure protein n=1 Tax=Tenacibaculum piscium TaxID=1458515 RepID=UPI001F3E984F|nr:phage tail tape measure protein [Tenacibaculum piscium]
MSSNSTTYNLNFNSNADQVFGSINKGFDSVNKSTQVVKKSFGDCFKSLLSFSLAMDGIDQLKNSLDDLLAPGISLNTQMADLAAITGLVDDGLNKIEASARKSAKAFGTDASQNVEAYKLILSQLSPEIAKNDKALLAMGDNVNILSKTMQGDTVAATNVLTTAMNQFSVSLDDPIKAGKIMGDMMNVMAAGAKEGSAELDKIQGALEQAGMMAKNANVSFVETNAAIQVLDKAGKKGAEGGVALRNVLATLSQGRFLPKEVREQLQGAGIDISKLTDKSIPLTDRLRELKPIINDGALVTKLFGKENSAAAVAMLNGVDAIDELKGKLTGTNTAVEQAEIVMGSYAEKMKRAKARFNDLKISIFNATESIAPAVQGFMSITTSVGQLAVSMNAIKSIYGAFNEQIVKGVKGLWKQIFATNTNTASMSIGGKIAHWYKTKIWSINRQMMVGSIASVIYSKAIKGIRNAMFQATLATHGFSVAIMAIPVVGWIIAGITAIVVGLKLLWDNSKRFREILFGVWEVGKAVFHNIGIVVSRLYTKIIKPIFGFIWKVIKTCFTSISSFAKSVWNGIGTGLQFVWNSVIKPILNAIESAFKFVFNAITKTVTNVWNWLTSTFSKFFGFINSAIITPIREAFSTLWSWVVGLLDKIFSKFNKILAPIKALWNAIFSKEGMIDVKVAYKEGKKKGAKSYDDDHQENEKSKENKQDKKQDTSEKSIFDVTKDSGLPPVKTIKDVATKQADKGSKNSTGGNKQVASLNITKLVETINIYNQNGTTMSKNKITQMVKEALLTATADFVALN